MKKIIISSIVLLSNFGAFAFSGSGAGTEKSPYLITSADELFEVRSDLNAYYKLANDIDLTFWIEENSSKYGWSPIGTTSSPFNGTFDGNGKIIKNLIIKRADLDCIGLFGCTQTGNFKNIVILNPQIEGHNYVGAILGYRYVDNNLGEPGFSESKVSNCYVVAGNVSGNSCIGGVVGYSYASTNCRGLIIERCHNSSNVTGSQYCGGICGYSDGLGYGTISITDCNSLGSITGDSYIGGIVGFAETHFGWVGNMPKDRPDLIIARNYVEGNISGKSNTNGITGFNNARGWDSGQWGSSHYEGIYTCTSNVCLADSIMGSYRIAANTSSPDNYASESTVMLLQNGKPFEVEDNSLNGTSMGAKLLQKGATYQSLGWDFQTIWADASGNEENPIHVGQSFAPKVESFEAKSKGVIYGTTVFNNGSVIAVINGVLYSTVVEDGKWEINIGYIQQGEMATVCAIENNKQPSSVIKVYAEKKQVDPITIVGDSNSDGVVDVTDIVAIINYILGKPSSSFNEKNADINGDGQILIDDAVGTVNEIINAQ